VFVLTVVGLLGGVSNALASSQMFMPTEGSEQQFKVPAGVTQVQVTAVGGAGQPGGECAVGGASAGGAGAEITAQLSVSEGETLSIDFGGGASGGAASSSCPAAAGGNGGGASSVSSDPPFTPLIVAGGGGGGGDGFGTEEPTVATGGAGGSATNLVGGDGAPGSFSFEGEAAFEGGGGQGGTDDSPGSGGSSVEGLTSGSNGERGTGGAGSSPPEGVLLLGAGAGGGGGGGYFGGGGGGLGALAGGGGGAGSSFIAPVASNGAVAVADGAPQEVVISFTGATAPTAPTGPTSPTGTGSGPSTGGPGNTGGGVLSSISTTIGSAQIAALLSNELKPSGKAAKIATLLKTSGFTVTFRALEAGTALIDWYEVPPGAKLAKQAKARPTLVATGQVAFPAAGTLKIKIKLTAAGKRLLKNIDSLKLTARGMFTPSGKPPIVTTKAFVLKR
jgi:hypothetical protein